MAQLNYSASVSGSGVPISRAMLVVTDGNSNRDLSIAAGKAGQLTTRTDANTGTITMSSGDHGITTGMAVDIHWDGGIQYDVTVGTVSGTSVPFDLGIGDDLPTNLTNVVVAPRVQINADIDGDNLKLIALDAGYIVPGATSKIHCEFQDAADDSIAALALTANEARVFHIEGGDENPFTGDPITKIFVSNGSSTEAATFKTIWAADNTP